MNQRNLTVMLGSPVRSFLLMKRHLDCVPLQRPPQYRIPPTCAFIAWASTSLPFVRVSSHLFGPAALDEVRTQESAPQSSILPTATVP